MSTEKFSQLSLEPNVLSGDLVIGLKDLGNGLFENVTFPSTAFGGISAGTATLSHGTVTVSATQVTANSKILVCYNTMNTSLGSTNSTATLAVPNATIVPGVGFTINSYLVSLGSGTAVWTTDNSTINYLVIG